MIRYPFHLSRALPLCAVLGAGCALDETDPDVPAPTSTEPSDLDDPGVERVVDAPDDCPLLARVEIRNGIVLEQGDIVLGEAADLPRLCAEDRETRQRGVGVASNLSRWPGGLVPVKIHPDLPNPWRVHNAMSIWNNATNAIHFVPYDSSAHSNYIEVVNGDWCSSPVGRQNVLALDKRQPLYLSTGKTPAGVRGMAIAGNDWVYTWYDDGMASAGSSVTSDSRRAQYPYTLPNGYTTNQIVEMAIDANDNVFTWYSNGKFSVGTSGALAAHQPPANYTLPAGKTKAMIRGMAFASSGQLVTYYSNATLSVGTPQDLGHYSGNAVIPYTAPGAPANILGLDIASNDWVYVWYANGANLKRTAGTLLDLDAHQDFKTTTLPRDCDVPTTVHELGHALGLFHEQTRCDRDDHLTVFYDNVDPDRTYNFDVSCWLSNDFGSYDFNSIMHYDSNAFSDNGNPTMLRHPPRGVPLAPAIVPLDAAIASNDHVYTWWSDGKVTAGTSYTLEVYRSRYPFSLPDNYALSDIRGIGIAKSTDRVYVYYSDGKYSIGSTSDLDLHDAPKPFVLPNKPNGGPYQPSDIHSVGIASDDHVYVWYKDGNVSAGKSDNLGYYRQPRAYQLAAGRTPGTTWGMAISSSDKSHAWYFDGHASNGGTEHLANADPEYDVGARGLWIDTKTQLSTGDIDTIEAMY